jgi:transposase InsO family protein
VGVVATAALRASLHDDTHATPIPARASDLPLRFAHWKPVLRGPIESGQFTSWAFSQKVKDAGLAPSMGAVGSAYDNAMVESFWGRMQVELFNRKRWKTRVELATAIHDYIELFHNTKRRHSSLNMLTPMEYEDQYQQINQRRSIAA